MEEHSQTKKPAGECDGVQRLNVSSKTSFFAGQTMEKRDVADVPPRSLAHLGDAVFHLFEREREIKLTHSVKQMHMRARVSADTQAALLEKITPHLLDDEVEIVRRARNVKVTASRRNQQAIYRRATAFEALLGYLYLTDPPRLQSILTLTLVTDGDSGEFPPETTK